MVASSAVASSSLTTPSHPLSLLESEHCNLATWRRPIPTYVSRALQLWAKRDPSTRFERTVHEPDAELSEAFWGLPTATSRWLEADVGALLRVLFEVSSGHAVVVKFGVVHSDQCRKFHVDYLRYRLITTYLGPGTEWVPNEHVNRNVLAAPPEDPAVANQQLVTSPGAVVCAAAGDILLMKGASHPHGVGLVHRSPPVEHLGAQRVVLVLSAPR